MAEGVKPDSQPDAKPSKSGKHRFLPGLVRAATQRCIVEVGMWAWGCREHVVEFLTTMFL